MEHLNILNTSVGIFIRLMMNIPLIVILGVYCYSFGVQRKKQSYKTITIVSIIYGLIFIMLLATYFILVISNIEPAIFLNKFLIAIMNTYFIFLVFGVYCIFQSSQRGDQNLFLSTGALVFFFSILWELSAAITVIAALSLIIYKYHKNLYNRKILIWAISLYGVSVLINLLSDFNGIFSLISSLLISCSIALIILNLTMYSFYLVKQKQRSSMTDPLTGLYNRSALNQAFNHYLKNNKEPGILFIDIDNFKHLNDTKGHKKGDEVLYDVAKICENVVHDIGIAARYGGEEIILLIYSEIDLIEFANNLVMNVKTKTCVTISVGVREFEPNVSFDRLIKDADKAMYQAKRQERTNL